MRLKWGRFPFRQFSFRYTPYSFGEKGSVPICFARIQARRLRSGRISVLNYYLHTYVDNQVFRETISFSNHRNNPALW